MKLQKIYKIILYVLPVLVLSLFFSGAIFLSASYGLFSVDVHEIDMTVDSLQSSSSEIIISRDPSYVEVYGPTPYKIDLNPTCNQYDEDFVECIDPVPDLCPYIDLQPKNEEDTEIGSIQDKFYANIEGQLYDPYVDEYNPLTETLDVTDTWTLSVSSPCFEGQCPAGYNAYLHGDPLPQSLKGATFKCNLHVLATDIPPLSMINSSTVYADIALDEVEVSAVLTGNLARNPVIIVPGLLGTEIYRGSEKLWLDIGRNIADAGDQFMDVLQLNEDFSPSDVTLYLGDVIRKVSIFDYSDNLVKEFQGQGYIEGIDLFLFPYDWRFGVSEGNVNNLQQKIVDVLTQTGSERVDVVAHSTGGLLVKKYVVENPADHSIDKAVFVGVPSTGAPKAVKALVIGDGFGVPFLAEAEMKKIAKNLPVAYDLLPSESYYNAKGSYIRIIESRPFSKTSKDLTFEESNDFLIDYNKLNGQALINANNLHTKDFDDYDLRTAGVDLYSVNGCKAGTIGGIEEVRHYPLFDRENYSSRYQIKQVPGDGTVPLESATNLPISESNKFYALNASHGEMMSQNGIRQKIVNTFSGSDLETEDITQDLSKCKLNGRAISIHSPLSIDIIDQDGNHAGLSEDGVTIENNIPNADFQIINDHKFVYLPTDDGQIYTINVSGTGTGVFTLTDAMIDGSDVTSMQVFNNIAVTPSLLGHVNISDNTTLELDNDGNGDIDQTLTADLVLGAEDAQNFIPELENTEEPKVSEASNSSGSRVKKEIEGVGDVAGLNGIVLGTEETRIPSLALSNLTKTINQETVTETDEFKSLEEFIETGWQDSFTANVAGVEDHNGNKFSVVFVVWVLALLLVARKFNKV